VEILINSYPVDFSLEHEKDLPDIVNSISSWASERDLVFSEVIIDGDLHGVDSVPGIALDSVEKLDCIVQSKADVTFSAINEGITYCDKITTYVTTVLEKGGADMPEINNIRNGIDWLQEILQRVLLLAGIDPGHCRNRDRTAADYSRDLMSLGAELRKMTDPAEAAAFMGERLETISGFREILRLIVFTGEIRDLVANSIDSPDVVIDSMASLKEEREDQLKNIEETAIAFQAGKDREGTERLNRFIDFLYRYTRTCCQAAPLFSVDLSEVTVNGVSLEEKNRILQEQLTEVSRIMEDNDIISLSDILEYEIKPHLEDIDLYIDKLVDIISGR